MPEVYIFKGDHSSTNRGSTGRYARSVVMCDGGKSPAIHCEALGVREHYAALSGLKGADETDSRSSRGVQLTRVIQNCLKSSWY
jgi:hypothetical protein